MKSLNIRCRLAIWNAIAILVILVLLSTCFLYKIHRHLHARADLELQEEIRELEEELQLFPSREELVSELNKRFSVHSHFCFELSDEHGETIFRSRFLTNIKLPTAPHPATMRGERFSNVMLEGLGEYRLLDMAIRDTDSHPLMLRAMRPQQALARDFQSYIWMLLTVAPIVVIASLWASYFWAGRALLPIKRINASVQKISADRLDDRLTVENPDDEIGELTITLNKAVDRVAKSVEAMKSFTSNAAHELRTPVAVMKAGAEVALRNSRTALEYRAVVESTLVETKRLEGIVDQLLTLSRLESSEHALSVDEVPIAALAKDVVERLAFVAEPKSIAIRAAAIPEGVLEGDEIAISQLLYNLTENATKYGGDGCSITVSGFERGGGIVVVVADTGVGIAPEEMPKIFDRFYRADKSRSEARGAGLGLAICKAIVSAHHGTMDVESQVGIGTRFEVFLPGFHSAGATETEGFDKLEWGMP